MILFKVVRLLYYDRDPFRQLKLTALKKLSKIIEWIKLAMCTQKLKTAVVDKTIASCFFVLLSYIISLFLFPATTKTKRSNISVAKPSKRAGFASDGVVFIDKQKHSRRRKIFKVVSEETDRRRRARIHRKWGVLSFAKSIGEITYWIIGPKKPVCVAAGERERCWATTKPHDPPFFSQYLFGAAYLW